MSPESSGQVKNEWSYTSSPLHASMACKVTTVPSNAKNSWPLTDLDNIQTDGNVRTQNSFWPYTGNAQTNDAKSHSSIGFHLVDTCNSTYLFCNQLHQSYYSWNQASSISVTSHGHWDTGLRVSDDIWYAVSNKDRLVTKQQINFRATTPQFTHYHLPL